jgi:hypothetical protein
MYLFLESFCIFEPENMIWTHTKDFCEQNGPNSPNFELKKKLSDFYNWFQHVAN